MKGGARWRKGQEMGMGVGDSVEVGGRRGVGGPGAPPRRPSLPFPSTFHLGHTTHRVGPPILFSTQGTNSLALGLFGGPEARATGKATCSGCQKSGFPDFLFNNFAKPGNGSHGRMSTSGRVDSRNVWYTGLVLMYVNVMGELGV